MEQLQKKYVIGIDIGGTKILTAILNRRHQIRAEVKERVEANKGERYFIEQLYETIEVVMESVKAKPREIAGIGIGCPGMIDTDKGVIKLSPNIGFLKNYALAQKLKKKFKLPVVIENDVNAGAYGEFAFGAAKGVRHVVNIFLGTGVGGALILDGKLYRGADGGAGEVGHTFMNFPNDFDGFASSATLEGCLGRHAISSEISVLNLRQQTPHLYEEAGFNLKKIKSKTILRAIDKGDTQVLKLMLHKSKILGLAMANMVNTLNPEMIVLGGGVVEAMGKYIIPTAKDIMKEYAQPPLVRKVKVVAAELKDHAIILGASQLLLESVAGTPKKKVIKKRQAKR